MAKSKIVSIAALCVLMLAVIVVFVYPGIGKDGRAGSLSDGQASAAVESQGVSGENKLEVLEVKFEPIQEGKNVMHVQVRNNASQDQSLIMYVYTLTGRAGWGRTFHETINAGATRSLRYAFMFREATGGSDYVRLRFYNPGLADGTDSFQWFRKEGNSEKWFKNIQYNCADMERRKTGDDKLVPASESQAAGVLGVFKEFQTLLKSGDYKQALALCTNDYLVAQHTDILLTRPDLLPNLELQDFVPWNMDEVPQLQPESVCSKGDALCLKARLENRTWTIDFIRDGEQWKMDWFAGYGPKGDWKDRWLVKMEKRNTKHFDIHYFKGSSAEKDIDRIVEQREKGIEEIGKFLGKEFTGRICLVFFEDADSKYRATKHQGSGWATGHTIVEIYNEGQKMDPYHEAVHIVMSPYGHPPALFNEGFAVYMVERMGAMTPNDLTGGKASIYERVRDLKGKNEWIPLSELITYTDIGPEWSRPPVAYPEAASFVKFLIDSYGKDKFLQAYGTLANSGDKQVHTRNIENLTTIYGKSLDELDKQWQQTFMKSQSQPDSGPQHAI